jgi:hypothetical protein
VLPLAAGLVVGIGRFILGGVGPLTTGHSTGGLPELVLEAAVRSLLPRRSSNLSCMIGTTRFPTIIKGRGLGGSFGSGIGG